MHYQLQVVVLFSSFLQKNLRIFSYITECSNRFRQHDRGETFNEYFCTSMTFNNKCILQQSLFSSTRIEWILSNLIQSSYEVAVSRALQWYKKSQQFFCDSIKISV